MKTASFQESRTGIGATPVEFSAFKVGGQKEVFVFAKVTGTTLTGTVKLQATANLVDWVDVTSSSQNMGSSGGNLYWNLSSFGGLAVRAVAAASVGTAAVEITGYAKG